MGSAIIKEVDSISDCSCRVLKAFKAMPMQALLFKCTNDTFNQSILLRTVRRYELLFQAITSDETGVIATVKNEDII